jgi:hypothetical protein
MEKQYGHLPAAPGFIQLQNGESVSLKGTGLTGCEKN